MIIFVSFAKYFACIVFFYVFVTFVRIGVCPKFGAASVVGLETIPQMGYARSSVLKNSPLFGDAP
jgi:hypothetical protein